METTKKLIETNEKVIEMTAKIYIAVKREISSSELSTKILETIKKVCEEYHCTEIVLIDDLKASPSTEFHYNDGTTCWTKFEVNEDSGKCFLLQIEYRVEAYKLGAKWPYSDDPYEDFFKYCLNAIKENSSRLVERIEISTTFDKEKMRNLYK